MDKAMACISDSKAIAASLVGWLGKSIADRWVMLD
jgi:hypothetical protein